MNKNTNKNITATGGKLSIYQSVQNYQKIHNKNIEKAYQDLNIMNAEFREKMKHYDSSLDILNLTHVCGNNNFDQELTKELKDFKYKDSLDSCEIKYQEREKEVVIKVNYNANDDSIKIKQTIENELKKSFEYIKTEDGYSSEHRYIDEKDIIYKSIVNKDHLLIGIFNPEHYELNKVYKNKHLFTVDEVKKSLVWLEYKNNSLQFSEYQNY